MVFLAVDIRTPRFVALKVLKPELVERWDIRARFDAEARAMAAIEHRNVLPFYDVGEYDEQPYIAMEYAKAGTLFDWITNHGPMPPRLAADAVTQVCKGMGAAHAVGIIHRDIKTHNILVTGRGVCKISDFGIARLQMSGLTATNHTLGTPGFMAPEQRNSAKEVDARADVYALGATLYHLLTAKMSGDLYFIDEDPDLTTGIPECLIPVLRKSTRYKPDERFETGAEMARALYAIRGEHDKPPPGTPRLSDTGIERHLPDLSEYGVPEVDDAFARETTEELVRPWSLPPLSLSPEDPEAKLAPLVENTPLPDYVDKSSLKKRERGFEITVDPTSRRMAQEARKQSLEDGVLEVVPEPPKRRFPFLAIGGLAALLLFGMIFVFMVLRAANAQTTMLEDRASWYEAIEGTAPGILTINALGGPGNELVVSLQDLEQLKEEPARMQAADAYQERFVALSERLANGSSAGEVELRRTATRLTTHRSALEESTARASRLRHSPPGYAAAIFGLMPDDDSD